MVKNIIKIWTKSKPDGAKKKIPNTQKKYGAATTEFDDHRKFTRLFETGRSFKGDACLNYEFITVNLNIIFFQRLPSLAIERLCRDELLNIFNSFAIPMHRRIRPRIANEPASSKVEDNDQIMREPKTNLRVKSPIKYSTSATDSSPLKRMRSFNGTKMMAINENVLKRPSTNGDSGNCVSVNKVVFEFKYHQMNKSLSKDIGQILLSQLSILNHARKT